MDRALSSFSRPFADWPAAFDLVCCVCWGEGGGLQFADWQAVIDINLGGVFLCSQAAAKVPCRKGRTQTNSHAGKPTPRCRAARGAHKQTPTRASRRQGAVPQGAHTNKQSRGPADAEVPCRPADAVSCGGQGRLVSGLLPEAAGAGGGTCEAQAWSPWSTTRNVKGGAQAWSPWSTGRRGVLVGWAARRGKALLGREAARSRRLRAANPGSGGAARGSGEV